MTVIVESDAASAEALHAAIGAGAALVPGIEHLRAHFEHHPGEYAVVLGPTVDIRAAVALADTLRVTLPTLGVILVRRRIDTTVLAEALRAGMREVVEERDLTGVNDAIARAYALHGALTAGSETPGEAAGSGILVTVFAAKGGVGKTTVATNLGAAIADNGKRSVCIVDLDLAFGDVSIVLQLFPVHTIADAVGMDSKLDPNVVESLLTDHSPGLKALAAPVQPDAKERISAGLIGKLLHILKERFDVVIVDTPPAFDEVVLQAFDESDLLLLIGTLDMPSLKSLKVSAETLSLLNHPKDRWRLVLNRADMKVGLTPAEVEKTLNMPITTHIPQSNDVPASINHGKPIVLENPKHPVSQSIRNLANEILLLAPVPINRTTTSHRTEEPEAPRRSGLLRRRAAK
ncbi:MAG: AAA family ATPase [Nocardioidaceae bacterium]